MGTELEYKYRVPDPETLGRVLAAAPQYALPVGQTRRLVMRTDYYDTPDGAFRARRWTLRLRTENGTPVVTLKTPLGGGVRGEWETEAQTVREAICALLAQGAPAGLAELASGELRRTCGAEFTRTAQLLELPDGSRCELAADLGQLCGSTERESLCELELELKRGAPEQTRLLGELLCAEFGLSPEPRSKLARALALK